MIIRLQAVARLAVVALLALTFARSGPATAAPAADMAWAGHTSIAPTWLDPAEHQGPITLMPTLYALLQGSGGGLGNAATRIESYVVGTWAFASGGHPEIDDVLKQQGRELDRKRREGLSQQIQKTGCRVEEAGHGLIQYHSYSSPYEGLRLKQ